MSALIISGALVTAINVMAWTVAPHPETPCTLSPAVRHYVFIAATLAMALIVGTI